MVPFQRPLDWRMSSYTAPTLVMPPVKFEQVPYRLPAASNTTPETGLSATLPSKLYKTCSRHAPPAEYRRHTVPLPNAPPTCVVPKILPQESRAGLMALGHPPSPPPVKACSTDSVQVPVELGVIRYATP